MSKGYLQFEIIGTSLAVTVVWFWASFEHNRRTFDLVQNYWTCHSPQCDRIAEINKAQTTSRE